MLSPAHRSEPNSPAASIESRDIELFSVTETEKKFNLRKEYKRALILSDILAINAKRFRREKFLLLHTVVEKDESHMTKDDNQNEDAALIGSLDDVKRKRVMTLCHKKLQ